MLNDMPHVCVVKPRTPISGVPAIRTGCLRHREPPGQRPITRGHKRRIPEPHGWELADDNVECRNPRCPV